MISGGPRANVSSLEERIMNTVEEYELTCPSCGEQVTVLIDASVEQQEYVEDCPVCCSPMLLTVSCDDRNGIRAWAQAENA